MTAWNFSGDPQTRITAVSFILLRVFDEAAFPVPEERLREYLENRRPSNGNVFTKDATYPEKQNRECRCNCLKCRFSYTYVYHDSDQCYIDLHVSVENKNRK